MIPKFFASWLAVLVVLPFTAPFSTCDLTGFFGQVQSRQMPVAPARSAVTTDAAVASVPSASAVGRVRLLPLSGGAAIHTKAALAAGGCRWSRVSVGSIRKHAVRTTVLRL